MEFNRLNIIDLKQNLAQIHKLEGSGAFGRCIESIERRLLEFSDSIVQRACSATSFHVELRKVIVWAEGFDEFGPVYARTSIRIVQFVSDLSNVLEADVQKFGYLSDEDLRVFTRNLARLHAICEQATQFPIFCTPDMVEVVIYKDSTMDKVESALKAWSKVTVESANDYDMIDEVEGYESLARAARTIQVIRPTLESFQEHSPFHFHRLKNLVTSNGIEAAVIGKFFRYYDEMSQTKFDPSWKPRLFWMHSICSHFAEMEGVSWRRMKPSFSSLIDPMKTDLHRASGEIDNMCSLIRDRSGMINGESFAQEFINLHEYKWMDELLPKDEQFVAKCCNRVIEMVNERIKLKRTELISIIESDLSAEASSVKGILAINKLRPELIELEMFSNVINHYGIYDEMRCGLSSACENTLEEYVSNLGIVARKYAAFWATKNASGRIGCMRAITRKLDNVLANVDALLTTGAMQTAIDIQTSLQDEFTKFNRAFNTEFSSFDGSFDSKIGFLTTIKACRDFRHVECRLINHNVAKKVVLELLLKESTKIESSIETSLHWDDIDGSLLKFEAATVLDDFVSGEVDSRLRTIRKLRERKEEQVDDHMLAMIRNHDFRGIGAFLSPLAQSKDQLKKQKFRSLQENIASILKDMIIEVNCLLNADVTIETNSSSASKKMDVLVAAEAELKTLLDSKLNLNYDLRAIKRQMNGILCQFTEKITKAINKKDFIQMVINKQQGSKYLSNTEQHLHVGDIRDFECAKNRLEMEMEETAVLKYVDNFFVSYFTDGCQLFKSMVSLKQAKDLGNKFPRLARLYDTTKKIIESNVQEYSHYMKEYARRTKCFDDCIPDLHLLYRHLQTDLRGHCSSELVSQVDHLIEELRRDKKLNDRFLELNGKEYKENLDKLVSNLDDMISPSLLQRGKDWFLGKDKRKSETYSRLCKEFSEKVEGRFNHALAALSAWDMLSVQGSIEFMELVQKKARDHVPVVDNRLEFIRTQCVDAFCNLCAKAIKLLSSDNCMPFKELFPDYRGFVVHVPCVLRSRPGQKSFAHVNQLLSKSLESALSTLRHCIDADILDSASLRSKVITLGAWGSFVADHLTLLHEEVNKVKDPTEQEIWLSKIHTFCWDHFEVGRDLSKLKYCAILGVVPSASEADIKRAFRDKAKLYHPDKNDSKDANQKFRVIKEAEEKLLKMRHVSSSTNSQPFDELIRGFGQSLRIRSQSFMDDQRYDMMEKLLFELRNINILDDLVVPRLSTNDISSSVFELVKGFVAQLRVEVETHWSERNYKELNDVITSLRSMERHFKSYTEIFPTSWDNGIRVDIESEIDALGDKA